MTRINIARYRQFVYNQKTGEVFGRTFKSWGKYFILYKVVFVISKDITSGHRTRSCSPETTNWSSVSPITLYTNLLYSPDRSILWSVLHSCWRDIRCTLSSVHHHITKTLREYHSMELWKICLPQLSECQDWYALILYH